MNKLFFIIPVFIVASLIFLPGFWVGVLLLVDFYTPWILFESNLYDKYHSFLVSRLTDKPEIPLPEISASEATYEKLNEVSKGFTFPVVIRGLLGNSSGVQNWKNAQWWIDNYPNEEVLCGTLSNVVEDCNIKRFFDDLSQGNPFYISGASKIFERHPELHDMIDNEKIRAIEPGQRTATQIFMGTTSMGSDIHSAIGVNIFRQIVGQKKWWFIPPNQTPYLKPSININGFSSHTKTMVGKMGEEPSPWLKKIVRYTTVLNPGDILINPPWFWHGILNLGEHPTDLVIGAPSRYGKGAATGAAFRSNTLFTLNSFATLIRNYGFKALSPDFKINLQTDIANNRRSREKKSLMVEEGHPFELAD